MDYNVKYEFFRFLDKKINENNNLVEECYGDKCCEYKCKLENELLNEIKQEYSKIENEVKDYRKRCNNMCKN